MLLWNVYKKHARHKTMSKIFYSLYDRLLQRPALAAAFAKVRRAKGAPGVDGQTTAAFANQLEEELDRLVNELRTRTYQPLPVRRVSIPKPDGGERNLGIPAVRDRVVQQALLDILGPIFDPDFHLSSYGYRPGRSCQQAVAKATMFVRDYDRKWVVDMDLSKCFDCLDHDLIIASLRRRITDGSVLALVRMFLESGVMIEGNWEATEIGSPQGGVISPLISNIYLDAFDQEMMRRNHRIVRYADDIAIYVSSERSAQRVLERVTRWIEKNLRIPVNRDKSRSGPTDKSAFLGFRLYADGRIGVSPKSISRLKGNVRKLWNAQQNRTSRQLRDQWREYINGWWNYFKIADWRREVTDLSGWIRRHIRKCFWLRWKTPAGRLNALKRLGVGQRSRGIAYTGFGAWAVARQRAMHQALKTATLVRYGFIIPWDFAEAQK